MVEVPKADVSRQGGVDPTSHALVAAQNAGARLARFAGTATRVCDETRRSR